MSKFKLGDKVKLKSKDLPLKVYNNVNLTHTIRSAINDSSFVAVVKLDSDNTIKVHTKLGDIWVGEDALELYQEQPVKEEIAATESDNKILTIQNIQNNEIRFQKSKASCKRGIVPAGSTISGRKDKIAISVGHLSYQVCNC